MINHNEKTIIAQCTPKGSGALALLRLSGSDAVNIAAQISKLASNEKLTDLKSHTIHYGSIVDDQSITIDKVMFIVMHGPKTFTGENVIEITCHNNPFIIEQIISLAISKGARIAQEGEFAKRAFLNGKIDLLQAEAINDLLNAHTQQAIKKSLSQLEGTFSNWILKIEKKLIKCLALCEASFEFIDDEIEFGPQIKADIEVMLNDIKEAKQKFNQQQQIKEGIRIALIGSVNAGKSSLFNTLIKKERAIVTNIAGTTRDSIEAGLYKEDYYLTIVDTAGLRTTDDIIEQAGIQRSFEEAHKADIILLVFDGSRDTNEHETTVYSQITKDYENKVIFVSNKCDLPVKLANDYLQISTKTKNNIPLLEQKIKEKIDSLLKKGDSPFLLNKRQFNLLGDLENKLIVINEMLSKQIDYEILSIHINEALQSISELSGKTVSENGMDAIFKEFCVGK